MSSTTGSDDRPIRGDDGADADAERVEKEGGALWVGGVWVPLE